MGCITAVPPASLAIPGTLPMTDVGALAKPLAAPAMFTGRPMRKSSSACFISRAVWKRL